MASRARVGAMMVAVLLWCAACAVPAHRGGGTGAGAPTSATPVAGVALTVLRTGGFAGVNDEIAVDADGGWTVTDRAGRHRTGRLTGEQRATLRGLATDPRLVEESKRAPGESRCADTFRYTLAVNSVRISFVDCPTDADQPQAARAVVTLVTRAVGD
jgi:hypothetical protein